MTSLSSGIEFTPAENLPVTEERTKDILFPSAGPDGEGRLSYRGRRGCDPRIISFGGKFWEWFV